MFWAREIEGIQLAGRCRVVLRIFLQKEEDRDCVGAKRVSGMASDGLAGCCVPWTRRDAVRDVLAASLLATQV